MDYRCLVHESMLRFQSRRLASTPVIYFHANANITDFLQETLASKKHKRDVGIVLGKKLVRSCTCCFSRVEKADNLKSDDCVSERSPLIRHISTTPDQETGHAEHEEATKQSRSHKATWSQVLNPQTNLVLLAYTAFALHTLAFDALLPVFLDYPKHNSPLQLSLKFFGGFGMDSETIGLVYAIQGVAGITLQFLFFPPITKYFGVIPCFRFSAALLPLTYFTMPLTALYAGTTASYATMTMLMFLKLIANIFYFPCCTILLTNSASSVEILGTLNGLATSVSGIGRALGPACIGYIFSIGAQHDFMVLPWWSMSLLALASCWISWNVNEGTGI